MRSEVSLPVSQPPRIPVMERTAACRCLFGAVNHQQNRTLLKNLNRLFDEQSQEKWNFNFKSDTPLPGRYTWEDIEDSQENVPEGYSLPQFAVFSPFPGTPVARVSSKRKCSEVVVDSVIKAKHVKLDTVVNNMDINTHTPLVQQGLLGRLDRLHQERSSARITRSQTRSQTRNAAVQCLKSSKSTKVTKSTKASVRKVIDFESQPSSAMQCARSTKITKSTKSIDSVRKAIDFDDHHQSSSVSSHCLSQKSTTSEARPSAFRPVVVKRSTKRSLDLMQTTQTTIPEFFQQKKMCTTSSNVLTVRCVKRKLDL